MDPQTETALGIGLTLLIYVSPVILAVGAFFIGGIIERKHFASIREREAEFAKLPAFPTRTLDGDIASEDGKLVTASVVVSMDYFKRILASLRNIFGGRIRTYESLLDRAKREAILRLKEQVPDHDMIINLRLETATLTYVQNRKEGLGGVEVLAYGTAVRFRDS